MVNMKESDYPVVPDPAAGMRLRLIITPGGGASGTGSVDAADYANGTLVANAINTWMRSGKIAGGVATALDLSDPAVIKINDTRTYAGEAGYVDVAVDPVTGVVTYTVDAAFKARVAGLEAARSLIQVKDAVSSGPLNYMNLPGGTGNYFSTPNNSAFNVAGDTCVVVRFQKPSSTPAADMTIVGRWNSTPGAAAWRLVLLTTGQFRFTYTVDGTAVSLLSTSAATPLAFDGTYIWLKVRRLSATSDTGFWTAADTGSDNVLPSSWTAFQLNRTSIVGPIYNNGGALSLPLTIGAYNSGASQPFTGQIGRVLWYSGTDELTGTLIVDANAADYTSGTTWTSPLGRVWTMNGTASVVQVGGGLTANTASEFSLGETDAFSTIAVLNHYTLMWETEATLINTSGAAVNFTPKLKVGGVDLFTFTPISIPTTAAGQIYNLAAAVRLSINASDGSTQIARAQLILNNAVTGTDQGSIVTAAPLVNVSGNRSGAIATITSIPLMQLRMTMAYIGTPTVSARALRTQLFLAAA